MSVSNGNEKIEVFGIPITVLYSYSHAVKSIMDSIKAGQKTFCMAINSEKAYCVKSDVEFNKVIHTADIHICDGMGIVIAIKILYGRNIRRITGIQLFLDLMTRAEKEGLKVFFLGATPESNRDACEKLLVKHPKLKIVGSHHGYFNDGAAVVRMINDSRSDMVFVALGSPRQEHWIGRYKHTIKASFLMGIGGTLDVVSGKAKRAPRFFQNIGAEGIYRIVTNPHRWRRLIIMPRYLLMVLQSKFKIGKGRVQHLEEI